MKAYRYSVNALNDEGRPDKWIEYYVPSSGICFNMKSIGKSEARNKNPAYPLTLVDISDQLVAELEKQLGDKKSHFFNADITQENQTFRALFIREQIPGKWRNEVMLISEFKTKDTQLFEHSFRIKGNSVLKNAIVEYIVHGTIPPNTSLGYLEQLVKNLDSEEKTSLIDSIKAKLIVMDKRLLAKKNAEDSHPIIYKGVMSAALGFFATRKLRCAHPMAGIAFVTLAGCVAAALYEKYEQNQADAFRKDRELREKELMQTLESSSCQHQI